MSYAGGGKMLIIIILGRIALLPIYLTICLAAKLSEIVSKIGCFLLGLFYTLMGILMLFTAFQQNWVAVGILTIFCVVALVAICLPILFEVIMEMLGEWMKKKLFA